MDTPWIRIGIHTPRNGGLKPRRRPLLLVCGGHLKVVLEVKLNLHEAPSRQRRKKGFNKYVKSKGEGSGRAGGGASMFSFGVLFSLQNL